MKNGKKFWTSKTFYVNILAVVAILLQNQFGFVLDAGTQVSILAAINVVLRLVTKEPIVWNN